MLQQLLAVFREAEGTPLTLATLSRRLDLPPAVVAQMVHTLVQRGRLVATGDDCTGCEACPLEQICAGMALPVQQGYELRERAGTGDRLLAQKV